MWRMRRIGRDDSIGAGRVMHRTESEQCKKYEWPFPHVSPKFILACKEPPAGQLE
jgi:hypothetical protein